MHFLPGLYHKLHKNTRFTSQEERKVRRARRGALIRLRDVESETARLLDRLIILRMERKEVGRYVDVHRGLMVPIRRLVPEILQEIFWQCLPTARNSVFSSQEAPLLLGQICSLWRQITYSTPRLWCSLHIVVMPSPFSEARLKAYDTWLTRSGILPLHISLITTQKPCTLTHEFQPYLNLIAKHARRLKSLHLQVTLFESICNLMDIPASDLPLLETLYISQHSPGSSNVTADWLSQKNSILFAPLLCVLCIQNYFLQLLEQPFQWGHLTGLVLNTESTEVSDVLELLMLCPNLETCAIFFDNQSYFPIWNDSQLSSNRPRVVLPTLQTLLICGELTRNDETLILLENLSTPALRHFTYKHLVIPYPAGKIIPSMRILFSLNIFRSFFQTLNEPLEELGFATDSLETRYLLELLSLFPELKRLSLRLVFHATKASVNDRLLSGFIPYEHRHHCQPCSLDDLEKRLEELIISPFRCLCPNLETFDINGALFSRHVLLEFLQSRLVDYDKYNFVHLRRFSISFDFEDCDMSDVAEEIDRLAEESGIVNMHLVQRPQNIWFPSD